MLNGYKIIDADSYVIEPLDMWFKDLEPEFKDFTLYACSHPMEQAYFT